MSDMGICHQLTASTKPYAVQTRKIRVSGLNAELKPLRLDRG